MEKRSRIKTLSDEQEAEIQRQIAADLDDADATDEDIAQARPFSQALPDIAKRIARARGRPKVEHPKQVVSIRLDPDVIAKFKATGTGWQARINDVLKRAKVG